MKQLSIGILANNDRIEVGITALQVAADHELTDSIQPVLDPGPILDAALIGALQRVEHYEIASYGTVATLAEAMGQKRIASRCLPIANLRGSVTQAPPTPAKGSESVNTEAIGEARENEEEEEEEKPVSTKFAGHSTCSARKSKGGSEEVEIFVDFGLFELLAATGSGVCLDLVLTIRHGWRRARD
jgi:hypothetical protein